MLDRDRVINWWIGRLADPDLAEWSGLPVRVVRMILENPKIRAGVTGGGRGRWTTRRLDAKARNAIPVVGALVDLGLSFDLASNIVSATPYFLSATSEIIDFVDTSQGIAVPAMEDPEGGWRPDDHLPWHVWDRRVYRCRDLKNKNATSGDLISIEVDYFNAHSDESGILHVDRSHVGMPDLDLIPVTPEPVYDGEIDPLGFYLPETCRPEAAPHLDDHLLIVNGRWIVHRSPEPRPRDSLEQGRRGIHVSQRDIQIIDDPISVIESDKKTVRVIGWGQDEEAQNAARYYLKNPITVLDVNMTLALRKMKRRALGLPVRETD